MIFQGILHSVNIVISQFCGSVIGYIRITFFEKKNLMSAFVRTLHWQYLYL